MNNIYLIGMPGCGKSTIGEILSQKLNKNHIDADKYLEAKFGEIIPDIFDKYGEDDFRSKEALTIEELSHMDNIIVSTGGGVVKRAGNKLPMQSSGTIVFIDTSPENILNNSSLGGRPLLKDRNNIFNLYNQRIELYKHFADIVVDNNSDIDTAVNHIIKNLT